MILHHTTMASPVGEIHLLASDIALRALLWPGELDDRGIAFAASARERATAEIVEGMNAILAQTVQELSEYFAGDRTVFDVPLDPQGSPFQLAVWEQLRRIPYGQTISYGEQAKRLGDGNKARAVGSANGRNPISIIVPCHRVVGANGSLTGFGGGLPNKAWLLQHESGLRLV